MGLIVLAIGPAAGEHDPLGQTVVPHRLVDEHAVVVRVEPEQRERHPGTHFAQHADQQRLLPDQERGALGPAGGDVGQHQRLDEGARGDRTGMRHEVDLDEAGRRVVPVRERPHWDRPAQRRWRPPAARTASGALALRSEGPVDRRRADREQRGPDLRDEVEVSVAFHRRQQGRDHRLQTLAADPVGGFPEHDQRLAHRRVVDPPFRSEGRRLTRWTGPEQPHRVLAVVTRHGRELVQDAGLLLTSAASVSSRQRHKQFITRRHAHPPYHHPHRRTRVGSKSDAATAQRSGAFQARQCDQSSRLPRYNRDRHGHRRLASFRSTSSADPLGSDPRSREPLRATRAALHRPHTRSDTDRDVVRPTLAGRGHLPGSACPPRRRDPAAMVRQGYRSYGSLPARPVLHRHPARHQADST
ncbi:hypothetical protein MPOCJGCO_3557 [Methylobacterium trifolii]|uniref:Uncharacterized protein n=1 Tax=Methylobacterium trifolii TaxID=1003092 RepID=A0ABQ4U1U5_9HYPH|nr:hypothetical protein MPOCJGCO_3557 [Methylobacterium trifolii]